MKNHSSFLRSLAAALLLACPAIASALATDAGTDYMTDKTNSYVRDQSSKAMENLNSILCSVGAMNPSDMVGLGNYIALIDDSICNPNDGGGQSASSNTGANYQPVVVNSSRTDNSSPMIVKVWLNQPRDNSSIKAYLSATQAPNLPTDPFGRFRMDYTESGTSSSGSGFINSTATGLEFYQGWSGSGGGGGGGGGTGTDTLQLKLNVTSSTVGSGALQNSQTGFGNPDLTTAFYFAYNDLYFRRSDGSNDVCFDRDPANAVESVWRYGLYASDTGDRIERNSGFPIEYTDGTTVMNGYVGYWGLNSPTTIANGATVTQVSYDTGSPVKTDYTLMQTGGKLIKFTKVLKTLDQLDKVKFQFWLQNAVSTLIQGTNYEAYWNTVDDTFVVSGQQDTASYNIVPITTPVPLTIAQMKTGMPWGLYGSSNMMGGSFSIDQLEMLTLAPTSVVITRAQDIVYPSGFAALGGMVCINNCPTAAAITASNNATTSPVSPYDANSINWTGPPGIALYSYTLDAGTGNLVDATGAATGQVVSTDTSGNNAWGINSGRLVATADLTALDSAVTTRNGTPNLYVQSDIDALTTYYEWQTGGNSWNQLAVLYSGTTPVTFDPPLNVSFDVPNTGPADVAKYGIAAGATITLQYGGFGNLWGIPSTCIDISTNSDCVLSGGSPTAQNLQRWSPEFSIPSGSSVADGGTTYLVKALEKEVRLAKLADCTSTGLTLPANGSVSLPTVLDWQDPTTNVGTQPTFNPMPAPQVIHGVKMY